MPSDDRNPFADNDNDHNPFADDLADDEVASDPYASPLADGGGYDANVAGEYDAMSPGRGGTLVTLGVVGLLISVIGIVPFFCCIPVNVLGLAFSLPAWLMAQSDLKAIDIGAIDAEARRSTKTARTMGIIGTVLALVVPPALLVTLLLLDVGTQSMRDFFAALGF